MEFELLNIKQIGDIKKSEDTFVMPVEITVGIVGTPTGIKYNSFKPVFINELDGVRAYNPIVFSYPGTLTANEIETGMIAFGQQWVATNFPTT
jgi:hypothetical protein